MSESLIDRSVFDELRETAGDEFVTELVETFLEEAQGMLAELKTAVVNSDADAFRRAAHSMKSNANVFGASVLAELARTLELSGLGQASDAEALEAEFARTAEVLRGLINAG